ncbi:MAG: FHA domain-containing protein [Gammaproteobacteria bacterium]|nr:FHA domain-containing protein [Gammaproteobacteria bacterium]MDH5650906.1 FHA domain-containing protein [Gammaproteobacteria bacterium]
MLRLQLKHEGIVIKSFHLEKPETTIGRKPDNDIQVDDAAVSGYHARLRLVENEYLDGHQDVYLEDAGSTNGTRVNGRDVTKIMLKNGDLIQIGKHQFTFDTGQAPDHEQTAIFLPDN